jgi:thymidylate kinase
VEGKIKITGFDLQKFFIEDRLQHYRDVIIPALTSGVNVICNRGVESTIVYGGNTIGGFNMVVRMHEHIFTLADVPFIWPDLIVIYDITPETAMKRMENSKPERDAFESELKARRVTSNYRALAALYPNCKLIDAEPEGEDGQKEIFLNVRQYIYPLLGITNF